MKMNIRNIVINKKILFLSIAVVIGLSLAFIGGRKVYTYYNVFHPNNYAAPAKATRATETSGKEGFIIVDQINQVNFTNPFIVQGSDNAYYLYGTNGVNSPTSSEIGKIEYYYSSYASGGKQWIGPVSQVVRGLPSNTTKPISPKVYKIGNYFYLIFTLITKSSNTNYDPYSSNSTSSVYYAISQTLDQNTEWTFKGEVPFGNGSSYFSTNAEKYKTGNTTLPNLNHTSGSLLLDDTNNNLTFDAADDVYFNFHFEAAVNGASNQESYSIKLGIDGNNLFYAKQSTPSLLLSRLAAGVDMIDDPYIIKDGPTYKMFFSTAINSTDLYTYNIGYATGGRQQFSLQNKSLLSERNSGGLSFFQIYTKDDMTNALYSDYYYVYHRGVADNLKPEAGNSSFYVRKRIDRTIGDESKTIIPRFTGAADLTTTDMFRNTVPKEKYSINGTPATNFSGVATTGSKYNLSIALDSRQDIREVWIYTNSDLSTNVTVVPDVNVNTVTPQISYRTKDEEGNWSSSYTVKRYNGVVRVIFPYDVKTTVFGVSSVPTKIKNIQIILNTDVGAINDIQLVALTKNVNQLDNYHFVDYYSGRNGLTPAVTVSSGCVSGLLKTTEKFTKVCEVSRSNYNVTYTAEKDTAHHNKMLTDDYVFDYMFEPIIYTINYDLNGSTAVAPATPSTTKFAYEVFKDAIDYKHVVINNPTRVGYKFTAWNDTSTSKAVTTSTITAGGAALKNYNLQAQWTPLTYTVTYNCNGGTLSSGSTTKTTNKTVTYDANYVVPADPYLIGYRFLGWYTEQTGGTRVTADSIVKITAAQTLYAHWEEGVYTVTFDPNGGTLSGSSTRSIKYNEKYYDEATGSGIRFPVATKPGYTFLKWTIDKVGGTEKKESSVAVDRDHTLYANWSANTIKVNFNANGGTCSTESANKLFGSTYNKAKDGSTSASLPKPTRTGYTFAGWYTAASGGTLVEGTTVVSTPNEHTLYAHWTPLELTVTLNLNDATGSTKGQTSTGQTTFTAVYDAKYSGLPSASRTGYQFNGWFDSATGTNQFLATQDVKITAAKTLYAHWTPIAYKITIDRNDGSNPTGPKIVNFDSVYDTTNFEKAPTRNNYKFLGWYTQPTVPTGTTPTYIVIGTTKVTTPSDHTIYAIWQGVSQTVTYNCNGGKIGSSSSTTKPSYFGSSYNFPDDPVKAGYTFAGWYTELEGGLRITNQQVFNQTTAQTLYAHWTPAIYTVKFESNGGTIVADKQYTYKGSYGKLPVVTKTGYTFAGWWTTSNFSSGTKIDDDTEVKITANSTFYAKWTPNTILVNFDPNTGTCTTASAEKRFDSTYNKAKDGSTAANLPTPKKTGYTFLGWFTERDGGTIVENTTVVKNPNTHTLYAHWRPNKFILNLIPNSGTISKTSVEVSYDGSYSVIPTPIRTGYTFAGWWTTASGSGTQYDITKTVALTNADGATVNFNARWSINSYKVSYNSNGGAAVDKVDTVTYNAKYPTLPTVTRVGYTFDGWYDAQTGGNKITGGTTVMSKATDHALYAHWIANEYTISLNPNGGSITTSTLKVTYDRPYGNLGTPTKIGKTFDGWWTSADGGNRIDSGTIVKITATTTLYAHWINTVYDVTLDARGGSVSPSKLSIEYDGSYSNLPTPTRSGFKFIGWFDAATGGIKVSNGSSIIRNANHTLYAQWDTTRYKITFNAQGGTCATASINVGKDENYGDLPTPTKTGYDFDGWYTAATGGTKVVSSTIKPAIGEETLYARYIAKKYNVTLNYQISGVANETKQVSYDGTYSVLPASPSRKGHTFLGWYTASTGGTKVNLTDKVQLTQNITLYARWQVVSYTITYNAQGGSAVNDTVIIPYGGNYPSTLPSTSKTGYKFDGWYDAETGGNKIVSGSVMNKDSNHVLYAHWVANSYTVTFNKNGGTINGSSITVTYGSKYTNLPITGTRTGYNFTGWKDESGKVITNDTIYEKAGNQTVTAQWDIITYTIKYGDLVKTYTVETPTFTLEQPASKNGYTFKGYTGNGITTPTKTITISKGSTGDKNYEAVWVLNDAPTTDPIKVIQSGSNKGQTVADYITKNSTYVKILNKNGVQKASTEIVKTSDVAVDANNNKTVLVVFMDVNSDGKISSADFVKLWNHLDKSNPSNLDGNDNVYARMAADINGDGKISTLDCVKLWNNLTK